MNALPNRVLLRTAHTVQPCIWKTLVYSMYVRGLGLKSLGLVFRQYLFPWGAPHGKVQFC
jgi:hypothetical protein